MSNTLAAIYRLVSAPVREIKAVYQSNNRANSTGDALEEYIKDLLADTLDETDEVERLRRFAGCFSYFGNPKNPPDMILQGSDAIEVKKLEQSSAPIALNSSYPKAKLRADSTMITAKARECEHWSEKDMLYVVAYVPSGVLRRLWFIYGDCFAASSGVYENAKATLKDGISEISQLEFADTNEIGRVNRVDPLGITHLRIRGMWILENPQRVFSYLNVVDSDADFQVLGLMRAEKFNQFPLEDQELLQGLQIEGYKIDDVEIKDPDNPSQLLNAKLINYTN